MIVLALTLAFLVLCIEDFAYFDYGILKFPTYWLGAFARFGLMRPLCLLRVGEHLTLVLQLTGTVEDAPLY